MTVDAAAYLKAMAYHEAGHAVVALALDLPVIAIHIHGMDEPGVNSITRTANPDHLPMIDHLAMSFAGLVAEVMFDCELSMPVCGDRRYARALLNGFCRDEAEGLIVLGTMRAQELLVEHRDKVIELAEHLIEVRRLDAVEFRRLMMVAPRPTETVEAILPQ